MSFNPIIADYNTKNKFEGALPTTIYYENGFCEVYGQNPDIDFMTLIYSLHHIVYLILLILKITPLLNHLNL
jgi:hypothetical protein